VGPNPPGWVACGPVARFQSSVRINVGPNGESPSAGGCDGLFQSSVRINVGPNCTVNVVRTDRRSVSILRED